MDVITRNFFRLLRAGAFGTEEQLEPMSVWKWKQLQHLSVMHQVADYLYQGVERCHDQFFLQLPDDLKQQWQQSAQETHAASPLRPTSEPSLSSTNHLLRLTNPLLNRQLQSILEEAEESPTLQLLRRLVGITTLTISTGVPIRQLTELGLMLQQHPRLDLGQLAQWTKQLRMNKMVQVTARLLIDLLGMEEAQVPFLNSEHTDTTKIMSDICSTEAMSQGTWYFSQKGGVFVHTTNSSALFWHARHSARYFRYYPAESLTNFVTSFARSLSQIEE